MTLTTYIKRSILGIALAASLTACDSAIYDGEGDCDITYRVKLTYTRNMKWADAFPAEVTHVSVYAFDPDGKIACRVERTVEQLRADDYYVTLPLDPGTYDLVSWCGGTSIETRAAGWSLDGGDAVATTADLTCRLATKPAPDGSHISDTDIHRLYHSTLSDVELPDSYGTHDFTMDLTKDTNMMRVILQHADGEPLDERYFEFKITDANTALDHTNAIASTAPVTYRPWAVTSAIAESAPVVNADGSRAPITSVTSLIAEMTTSRLVVTARPQLTINYTEPGKEHLVASLPLIDYFLMIKGTANRHISDQDFLDRQDDYALMFILDDNNRWNLNLGLYINSWRIVLQDADLK